MQGWRERNGGASVAEPPATCPANTATANTSAMTATAATHRSAGNRQAGFAQQIVNPRRIDPDRRCQLGPALPLVILALAATTASLLALARRRYPLARGATVIATGALMWGG